MQKSKPLIISHAVVFCVGAWFGYAKSGFMNSVHQYINPSSDRESISREDMYRELFADPVQDVYRNEKDISDKLRSD